MARKRHGSAGARTETHEKATAPNSLHALRREIETLNERNLNLVARFVLIEGNAERLGIDPEELYKPLLPPQPLRITAVRRAR